MVYRKYKHICLLFLSTCIYFAVYVKVFTPWSTLTAHKKSEENSWLQNFMESENTTESLQEKVFSYLKKRGKLTSESSIQLLEQYVNQIDPQKLLKFHQDPGVILVPEAFRIQHPNHTWDGMPLPLLTAVPKGRTGNVMGEYATLFALRKIYNVSVAIHENMLLALEGFPHLSISKTIPADTNETLWHRLGNEGGTFSYGPFELAAAGLFGPKLFMFGCFGFEVQLFDLYRKEIRKEFTFSPKLQSKADLFLHSVLDEYGKLKNQIFTFIGVHIRRTDYANHVQLLFNGTLPGEEYLEKALHYFRLKFDFPIFIASSDDKSYLRNSTLFDTEDVFISKGNSSKEDMAILASCNHSIITLGTYGFWSGYLAGGEVVYPVDSSLENPYRLNDRSYAELNLKNFTPIIY